MQKGERYFKQAVFRAIDAQLIMPDKESLSVDLVVLYVHSHIQSFPLRKRSFASTGLYDDFSPCFTTASVSAANMGINISKKIGLTSATLDFGQDLNHRAVLHRYQPDIIFHGDAFSKAAPDGK